MPSLELPDHRREDYANPWGPVVAGSLKGRVSGVQGLICVGDVVSRYCLELLGVVESLVLVYDRRTRRVEAVEGLDTAGFKRITLANRRGTLSLEVYRVLCDIVGGRGLRVALEVVGEEDMVALAAIACLREGWAVVYGIPGVGACIVGYSALNARMAQTRILQLKPHSER
jgi:uncharacterized protein (UPF0218 family)